MPSVYNTFSNTQAKINANATFNLANSRARIGGTANTAFTGQTTLALASGFNNSSNAGITDAIIGGSGPVGLSLGYATGTTIGAADEIVKMVDLGISNLNLANYDGINGKTGFTEQYTQGSGLRMLNNGTWVSATGAAVAIPAHVTGYVGADETLNRGRSSAGRQDYEFRQGIVNTGITLGQRSI